MAISLDSFAACRSLLELQQLAVRASSSPTGVNTRPGALLAGNALLGGGALGFHRAGEERAGLPPERPGPTQDRLEAEPEPRPPSPEPVCRVQPCRPGASPGCAGPASPSAWEQMFSFLWLEGTRHCARQVESWCPFAGPGGQQGSPPVTSGMRRRRDPPNISPGKLQL